MDDVDIIPSDVITDSLPALPEIPDIPDIPEDVIVVQSAGEPPATTQAVSTPPAITTTVAGPHSQLTYVTQGNISFRFQPDTELASNATTTTINVPTTTLAGPKPPAPPSLVLVDPNAAESGPPPPKKPKIDDSVFLAPLPIISYAKPPTRITRNTKPKPSPLSSNQNQNQLIKALLAQKSPPPQAARPTSFIIRASTQTASGKTKILNLPVSVSAPVSIMRNATPGTSVAPNVTQNAILLAQRPTLRSAFVKTSTAAESIAQSTAVSTVVSSHTTTTTVITTPTTATPQVTYALSPIATTAGAIVTTTVTSATAKPLMFITTAAPKSRSSGVTASKTFMPLPHLCKTNQDPSAKQTHNLVRSTILPPFSGTRVTTPATITMLGPRGIITTTAGVATLVQRPPVSAQPTTYTPSTTNTQSTSSNLPTYQNRYLEPGEIPRKVPPRTFPGPRTTVAQRQASAAAMQQQATNMSQLKAAKHAKHHAEAQATLRSQAHQAPSREILHATSLAALQAETHAKLEAAAQARMKTVHQQALLQAKLPCTTQAQNALALQPHTMVTAQSQVTPTTQQPATTQRPMQSLGPIQTVSLAQPHGSAVNVQILTPAQAQLLVTSKSQTQTASQAQILGVQSPILTTTRAHNQQATAQARAQLIASTQPQHQPGTSQARAQILVSSQPNTQLLVASQAQTQLLVASQAQVLAASQSRAQILTTQQARAQLFTTTQARSKLGATSQTQGHLLSASHVAGQILVASKVQASSQARSQVLTTTPSQTQLLPSSQVQAQILTTSPGQSQVLNTSNSQTHLLVAANTQSLNISTEQTQTVTPTSHSNAPNQANLASKPRANAALIAQLNAPPQLLISHPQSNIPHMQLHGTPAQLNSITQAQLNAISQAHKTSQQGSTPAHIQMITPPHNIGMVPPGHRHRLIIKTANPTLLDPAASEATASASQTEPVAASQTLSAAHTTSTLTLSTGTTLIMPHYKTTVFKNLSTLGRTETTRLATPTTTANERVVIRRPVAYFSARRSFPTQPAASTNVIAVSTVTATTAGTTATTTTTGTAVHRHIIRTIPRHVLGTRLQSPALVNQASRLAAVVTTSSSVIPTLIITQTKPNNDNN